jgi:hypothetical protein
MCGKFDHRSSDIFFRIATFRFRTSVICCSGSKASTLAENNDSQSIIFNYTISKPYD